VKNLPQRVEVMLQSVSANIIELEQYMDFVRNRMFRQTLLCHGALEVERNITPERILGLYVASRAKPESDLVDVASNEQAVFRGPGAVTRTTEPLVKAALMHLGSIYPRALPFPELLAIARSKVSAQAAVVDTSRIGHDSRRLAEPLVRCYATTQVELTVQPWDCALELPERPATTPFARLQAEDNNIVTNLRHELVRVDDLERHIIRHLDGSHDQAALIEAMARLAVEGQLLVHENGVTVKDMARIQDILSEPVRQALESLLHRCMIRN
jgi:methyltransferase-like protein